VVIISAFLDLEKNISFSDNLLGPGTGTTPGLSVKKSPFYFILNISNLYEIILNSNFFQKITTKPLDIWHEKKRRKTWQA